MSIYTLGGAGVTAVARFTPVAAAYSAGDVVGSPMEFVFQLADGTAVPQGALIRIISAVTKVDATALISGETSYSVALYSVTPPSALADNAAWTLASADLASYRGSLSLGTPVDLGSALYVKTQFTDQQDFNLTGNSLFGQLIAAGAATYPAVIRSVLLYGFVV